MYLGENELKNYFTAAMALNTLRHQRIGASVDDGSDGVAELQGIVKNSEWPRLQQASLAALAAHAAPTAELAVGRQ